MNKIDPFDEIRDTYGYALENNIDPKRPETWDDKYKQRMRKLAGIVEDAREYLNEVQLCLKKIDD